MLNKIKALFSVDLFTAHYQPLTDRTQGTKSFAITKTVPGCNALNAKNNLSDMGYCLVDGLLTYIVLRSCDTREPFHYTTLMSEDIPLHCLQVCEK